MPVDLNAIANGTATAATNLTPKFFHRTLTGNGKKAAGVINQFINPATPEKNTAANENSKEVLRLYSNRNSGIVTRYIPIVPIQPELTLELMQAPGAHPTITLPESYLMFEVGDATGNLTITQDATAYLDVQPVQIVTHEDETVGVKSRKLTIRYRISMVFMHDDTKEYAYAVDFDKLPLSASDAQVTGIAHATHGQNNYASVVFTDNVPETLIRVMGDFSDKRYNLHAKMDEILTWLREDYEVYERICENADVWATDRIGTVNAEAVAQFANITSPTRELARALMNQMRYLETYEVTLDGYQIVHDELQKVFAGDPHALARITKQNFNLLMAYELNTLRNIKPQLLNDHVGRNFTPPPAHFSKQQVEAITTDEPLVMVQAGAGTGKSTTILERINNITSRGIAPDDITVLSFTNAAADNITDRCPGVNAMTIASMLMSIYHENYPTHKQSSNETLVNCIRIKFPHDDFAMTFTQMLWAVHKNERGSLTAMNNFIEENFEQVIKILDTVQQTTLEIHSMVCYQQLETLREPKEVQSKYLIVDEVQDNSIFEFIYALKYVAKHKSNLYIVGDCSQTLFEFRNANPRALNALEKSGIFTTYQLTTNYRSNQEVLDFANVALSDIQANEFAQIQLRANSLDEPTEASFREKVKLDYEMFPKIGEFRKTLPGFLRVRAKDYIDECIAKGERVAILAPKREEVRLAHEEMERLYPNLIVHNMMPEKPYNSTVFSKFVQLFWNDVKQVPPDQATFVIRQELINNLHALTSNAEKKEQQILEAFSKWYVATDKEVKSWIKLVDMKMIPTDEFYDRLAESLIDAEIRTNSLRIRMTSQRNAAVKEDGVAARANILCSTIHSAKGLEFDNTVVIYRDEGELSEANKRMYYVALTRAMKRELVLAYGSRKSPAIVSDYDALCATLVERDDQKAALAAQRAAVSSAAAATTASDAHAQPVTGTLLKGTCPICGFSEARGNQCDNCDNQFDPNDLINPHESA